MTTLPAKAGSFRAVRNPWLQQELLRLRVGRTLLRVWRGLRPYRGLLALGTVVMLAGVGLGLVPPLLIRAQIDVALPRKEPVHRSLESL